MIHATIADFVNNPINVSELVEDDDYDLAAAAAFQKQIDTLCKVVLKNVSKAI